MTCKLKYISLLLCLYAAFAACSDDVSLDPNEGKTMIELGVGGVDTDMLTRAVITDGTNKTMKNFDTNTKIFMIMKSEYSALPSPYEYLNYEGGSDAKYTVSRGDVTANTNKVVFDATNKKYWDDAHARSTKLNIWAYAQKGMTWTECSFAVDDASADPPYKKESFQTTNSIGWRTSAVYPMIFNWKASHYTGDNTNKQDGITVMCQDLLFSNNLADNTSYSKPDGRLAFDPATRKFPTEGNAEMKFYHAMSKITIKINEGNGFDKTSTTDFQFKSGTNVKLTGFNTEGLFSIQQGIFQQINAHADIPSIYLKSTSTSGAPYYTLEALAVPNIDEFMQTYVPAQNDVFSRFVMDAKSQATDVMMEFTIDDNTYRVTSGQLYDALHVDGDPSKALVTNAVEKTNNGKYIPLEAGKNYVFTFTLGKQEIDHITATVAVWEEVEATAQNLTNARVTIDIEDDRNDATAPSYAFYRLEDNESSIPADANTVANYNWKTKYLTDTDHMCYLTYGTSGWSLTDALTGGNAVSWYWPNSKTFYHFRTVQPADASITENGTNGDYFTIQSTFNNDTQYDPRWGAPFKEIDQTEADKLIYNKTTGFDVNRNGGGITDNPHQIYKAIGATTQAIKIIPIHMMSQVTFNITTSEGEDAVELVDGANNQTKVELLQYYKDATVRLGSGLVTVTGSRTDFEIEQLSAPTATNPAATYFYSVVPQDLTNVELRITTPDNNRYLVPLKDITSASVSNNELVNPYTLENGKYKIDYWYPNYKYTYTFKLTKKGITDLKATIVDWETVVAGDDNVQIQ